MKTFKGFTNYIALMRNKIENIKREKENIKTTK